MSLERAGVGVNHGWRERFEIEEKRRSLLTPEQRKAEDSKKEADDIARRKADDERREAERVAARIKNAGVSRRHAQSEISNFKTFCGKSREVKSLVQSYAENCAGVMDSGASLIMCGGTGTGKTHLGMALVKHWILTGMGAYYTTIPDMLAEIRATYSSDFEHGDGEARVLKKYSNCQLLVLDEAGAHRSSEHAMEMLFNVVNRRSNNVLPTVLISNLPFGELADSVGSRVISRLREGGGPVLIFDWADFREQTS